MRGFKILIDSKRVVNHVAIIMDGNGRWAKKRSLPRIEGHRRGSEIIEPIVEGAHSIGVRVLSLYAFSTENWSRPKSEIDGLWNIIEEFIETTKDRLIKNGVKVKLSGTMRRLPASTKKIINDFMKETEDNKKMIVNICLNYGGRQEIVDSVNRWINDRKGNEELTIKKMNRYLYTAGLPEIDLMIRTGGEYRLSNFLLWQLAYSELIFMKVLWPDFRPKHLYKAIYEFQKRERRFGGL